MTAGAVQCQSGWRGYIAAMAPRARHAILLAALVASACGEVTIAPAGVRLDLRGKVRAAATGLTIGGARVSLYAPSDTAVGIDSTVVIADGSGNYRVVHPLADKADCPSMRLQASAAGYATTTVPTDAIYCMEAAQIVNIELDALRDLASAPGRVYYRESLHRR